MHTCSRFMEAPSETSAAALMRGLEIIKELLLHVRSLAESDRIASKRFETYASMLIW